MADLKISQLPAADALVGDELVELVQTGANVRGTVDDLAEFARDGMIESIVAGTNVTVDDTDPQNPIISASGGGGGSSTTYPDPARVWFGPSNVTVDGVAFNICGDPFIVWDGTQWVMFFSRVNAGGAKCYRRTAPTLEGTWSAATEIVEMDDHHKPAILVDEEGAPVQVSGTYHAYSVSYTGTLTSKEIYHWTAATLTGTWTLSGKVIAKGAAGTKDEYFTDAPFGLYKNNTVYLWYMGAPSSALPTYGLAIRKLRATASAPAGAFTKDYTDVIDLSTTPGAWNYGWHGGTQVQLRPDGTYVMYMNCGDTRPVSAGIEPDGSRVGLAYASSVDGPWTYDTTCNPVYRFDGEPSDALDQANIWKAYAVYDPLLKSWYLFYNTGSGSAEVITYARQNYYSYSNAPGGGSSYNIQFVTTSVVQLAGTRVNLLPGVYEVNLMVNYISDSGGTIRALDFDTVMRLNGVAISTGPNSVPNRDFIGSYAYENRDSAMSRHITLTAPGYIDFTTQVTGGTPDALETIARRLRLNVQRILD